MAVPKKRRSKAKGRTRLASWKKKAGKSADRALALAKSILNKDSKFLFDSKKKNDEEEVNSNNQEIITDELISDKDNE
uniref:Large ribosomal subunit protein bL32c n=1 Tax=Desmarestia aculeata TaxID=62298 RepID=A0A8F0JZG6_9PHAE|nr:50S ribosomal protein L32 [Desmarestia aculeata]QWK43693.1 ribosomal protein L32 [Desmarestia aculeata]WAM62890.1 50S ribosomal protein L32 [Desmarestia aculeata]